MLTRLTTKKTPYYNNNETVETCMVQRQCEANKHIDAAVTICSPKTQIGATIRAHPNLLATSRLATLCNNGSDIRLHVGHSRPGSRMASSWRCAQWVVEFCSDLVRFGPQVLLRCLQRIQILLILGNPMGDPFRTPDQTCSSFVLEVDVIRYASCCSAYVSPHCSKGSDTHLFRCIAANGRKKPSPPRAVQHRTN